MRPRYGPQAAFLAQMFCISTGVLEMWNKYVPQQGLQNYFAFNSRTTAGMGPPACRIQLAPNQNKTHRHQDDISAMGFNYVGSVSDNARLSGPAFKAPWVTSSLLALGETEMKGSTLRVLFTLRSGHTEVLTYRGAVVVKQHSVFLRLLCPTEGLEALQTKLFSMRHFKEYLIFNI